MKDLGGFVERSRGPREARALVCWAAALIFIALSTSAHAAEPSPVSVMIAGSPSTEASSLVELLKSLVWPALILAIAWFYRDTLGPLVRGLSSRITKVSIADFEIELGSTARPASSVSLEQIKEPTLATMPDSSQRLFQEVQDSSPADYVVVDLGDGKEWLTSRLFIGVTMLARMRGLKTVVFVENSADTDRRFVAAANASDLRWAIARRYPWLEAAYTRTCSDAQGIPESITKKDTFINSETGGVDPFRAGSMVQNFVNLIQRQPPNLQALSEADKKAEWTDLRDGKVEHAKYVTRSRLRRLLGDKPFNAYVKDGESPEALRNAIIRAPGSYVALLTDYREFKKLIDRGALLEKSVLAASE